MQTFVTNIVTNNVFLTKSKNTTTSKQKMKQQKTLAGSGDWTRDIFCTQSGCVTTAPPSELTVSIVVKPFNCFDAMGRNVNKQSQLCGPDIFNKCIFSAIFLHASIIIFGSFSYLREYVSLLKGDMSDLLISYLSAIY